VPRRESADLGLQLRHDSKQAAASSILTGRDMRADTHPPGRALLYNEPGKREEQTSSPRKSQGRIVNCMLTCLLDGLVVACCAFDGPSGSSGTAFSYPADRGALAGPLHQGVHPQYVAGVVKHSAKRTHRSARSRILPREQSLADRITWQDEGAPRLLRTGATGFTRSCLSRYRVKKQQPGKRESTPTK
jgi:hypothetical protein